MDEKGKRGHGHERNEVRERIACGLRQNFSLNPGEFINELDGEIGETLHDFDFKSGKFFTIFHFPGSLGKVSTWNSRLKNSNIVVDCSYN